MTRSVKSLFVALIVTALGSGYAPKAPGTAGTLMALILISIYSTLSTEVSIALWMITFVLGWWATLEWSRATQNPDNQKIVIDEVLGYWVATFGLPKDPLTLLIQFISFRLFDALKPPPIRQLDQYGKKFPIGLKQSFGVIADDLLAGLMSLALFHLLIKPFL